MSDLKLLHIKRLPQPPQLFDLEPPIHQDAMIGSPFGGPR